jgi:hypothetical protein
MTDRTGLTSSVDAARGVVLVGGIGSDEPLDSSFAAERQRDVVAAIGFKIEPRLEPVRRSLRPQVTAADLPPKKITSIFKVSTSTLVLVARNIAFASAVIIARSKADRVKTRPDFV